MKLECHTLYFETRPPALPFYCVAKWLIMDIAMNSGRLDARTKIE